MNTTTPPTETRALRSRLVLLRDAAIAGVAAAAVTTIIAVVAAAAEVSLAVDSKEIPIAAFAFWTLVATALGVGIAAIARSRRRFVVATFAGTGLSLIPALVMPDDTATRIVLVAAHLAAAAIIVPVIARNLGES